MGNPVKLDTLTVGEVPPPLVTTFEDAQGIPIDLSGFTAIFALRDPGGGITEKSAPDQIFIAPNQTINTGQVTVDFVHADFATIAGDYTAELWVGNGTARYVAEFQIFVQAAIEVPNI